MSAKGVRIVNKGVNAGVVTPRNSPRRKRKPDTKVDSGESEEQTDMPVAEFPTLCPQPRRALLPPGSPGELPLPGSPLCVHDAACQELRELMGRDHEKENFNALSGRPLSSVSTSAGTSAGPTPSPDSRPISSVDVAPIMPQWPRIDEDEVDYGMCEELSFQCSTPAPTENGTKSKKAAPPCKVFIGGVPQELEQDEVRQILNEYAPVKKCWLQRHKENATPGRNGTSKHRGFGFVVFADAAAVDRLLGDKRSRFLPLRDGRRLEVKRAMSAMDMQTTSSKQELTNGPRPPSQSGEAGSRKLAIGPPPKSGAGTPAPHAPPGNWPSDPRSQGGTSSEHGLASPAKTIGRQTPVLPPSPPPWTCGGQAPVPSQMITNLFDVNMAAMMADGRCVAIMPPGQAQAGPVVLPVGPGGTAMQCASLRAPPGHPNGAQQHATSPTPQGGTTQAMSVQAQQAAAMAQVQMPAQWCRLPWAMDIMQRGGTYAVAQPGGVAPVQMPQVPNWQAMQQQQALQLQQQQQQQQQQQLQQQRQQQAAQQLAQQQQQQQQAAQQQAAQQQLPQQPQQQAQQSQQQPQQQQQLPQQQAQQQQQPQQQQQLQQQPQLQLPQHAHQSQQMPQTQTQSQSSHSSQQQSQQEAQQQLQQLQMQHVQQLHQQQQRLLEQQQRTPEQARPQEQKAQVMPPMLPVGNGSVVQPGPVRQNSERQLPVYTQTPVSPHHNTGNKQGAMPPAYARELAEALLQAMPDHYDD